MPGFAEGAVNQRPSFCDLQHSDLALYDWHGIIESEVCSLDTELPMRTFFNIAIMTVIAATFWFGSHTAALAPHLGG